MKIPQAVSRNGVMADASSPAVTAPIARHGAIVKNQNVAVRLSSRFVRPGLMGVLFTELRLAWRLMREPRVPALAKAVPVLAILYVASPIDIIPDVLPVIGQIDDIGSLVLAVKAFLKMCPAGVAAHHAAAIASGRRYAPMAAADIVIDAKYTRN